MIERLTREQMAERYPNQWLGIKNVRYRNNDGITLESAEVVYTGKTKDELVSKQILGAEGIIAWYTSENEVPMIFIS